MEHFDYYEIPDESFRQKRYKHYFVNYIKPFFPSDKAAKILDLGCGYGLFLNACKICGYENIEGVEMIEKFVDFGRDSLGLKKIKCGDLFEYLASQKDSDYEVITAFNVLEHIKKDRVYQLFDLIRKKLKPGGVFIIEVPNADSQHGLSILFSDLSHEWAYSKRLLNQLYKLHGFVNAKILPSDVRTNKLIRLCQKILTKIVSGDDKLMYSSNLICAAYKKETDRSLHRH